MIFTGISMGAVFMHCILSLSTAFAAEQTAIGKIVSLVQKEIYPIEILENGSQRRSACLDCPIFENDVIITRRSQNLNLRFNDGTELAIGPDSHVTIDNWSHRNAAGFLKRKILMSQGALRATVKRVYSEDEPFLVKAKNAVIAVRGTQFIAFIERERTNKFAFDSTVNLFTLEGEVHFAPSEEDLSKGEYVITLANHRSVLYHNAKQPTAPRKFQIAELRTLMQKALPQAAAQIVVQKNSYDAKEQSIRSVISPTPSQDKASASEVETSKSAFPQRLPHTHTRDDKKTETSFSAALSRAESAKAHRKAVETNEVLNSDDEVMAKQREFDRRTQEQQLLYESKHPEPGIRPGYGPGPDGLSTFRAANPTSPSRLQQGQPRPQTAPDLRRNLTR